MDRSQGSSHQLDFYQAMTDFKLMFPNMDEEIIEAVLRANGGAVDGTIDQLLTMNTDVDMPVTSAAGSSVFTSFSGKLPFDVKPKRVVELSGRNWLLSSDASSDSNNSNISDQSKSFSRCLDSRSSARSLLGSTSGLQQPKKSESRGISSLSSISSNISENLLLLDTTTDESNVQESSADVMDGAFGCDDHTPSHLWDDDSFLPAAPAPPIPPRSPLPVAPPLPPKMSMLSFVAPSLGRGALSQQMSEPKKMQRHWDPPMLGKLPDDFLRIEVSSSTQKPFKTSPSSSSHGAFVSHSVHESARPRTSSQDVSPLQGSRSKPARLHSEAGHTRSHQSTAHGHRRSHDGVSSVPHSCDCHRHFSGTGVTSERMSKSDRRVEIDASTWQMLEDERLALVLQSEEFLSELRQNEDFMRSLEHERQLRMSGEGIQSALPLDKSSHSEDSAEFRTLLKHIGDSSKKKLIAAAQKFFAKCKKKSQKQILRDTAAPSTINLLDDDEAENKDVTDENVQFTDEQFKWWSQQ